MLMNALGGSPAVCFGVAGSKTMIGVGRGPGVGQGHCVSGLGDYHRILRPLRTGSDFDRGPRRRRRRFRRLVRSRWDGGPRRACVNWLVVLYRAEADEPLEASQPLKHLVQSIVTIGVPSIG